MNDVINHLRKIVDHALNNSGNYITGIRFIKQGDLNKCDDIFVQVTREETKNKDFPTSLPVTKLENLSEEEQKQLDALYKISNIRILAQRKTHLLMEMVKVRIEDFILRKENVLSATVNCGQCINDECKIEINIVYTSREKYSTVLSVSYIALESDFNYFIEDLCNSIFKDHE